jgi:hypothetical protein
MEKLDIAQVVQALDQLGAKKRFSDVSHGGTEFCECIRRLQYSLTFKSVNFQTWYAFGRTSASTLKPNSVRDE